MPIVSALSTGYIELVRGVPLITVLFVATFVFPLLLPEWLQCDAFWRVAIGIALFQAAYMAETVRGGLQTISQGQYAAGPISGVYRKAVLPVRDPAAGFGSHYSRVCQQLAFLLHGHVPSYRRLYV